jgi:membrane protease YdiL (CAAX protease family)
MSAPGPTWPWAIVAALGLPIGAEILFRGFVHGRVLRCRPVRRDGESFGPAALASALLYGAATFALANGPVAVLAPSYAGLPPAALLGGALLFGLAAGAARERSGSLLPPVVLHVTGAAIAWVLPAVAMGG